jgi:hypothetical protein
VVLGSAFLDSVGDSATLKIVTPDGKNYTLSPEARMDKENVFNQQYLCEMKFLKEDLLNSIYVSCKNGKETLGEAYINWSEAIYFTKDYSENKACILYKDKQKTKHKFYLKFRFLTKIQARQLKMEENSKQPKVDSTHRKGVLKVGIVRAKNLVGEEKGDDGKMKSDPFVQLRFKNDDKPIKFTTDVVESSLNPVFNDHFSFNLKILKEGTTPPLELEVYDHDTWSSNDLIATGFVRIDDCILKPGEWAVNGWFPLKPIKGSTVAAGEIYIRAYFIPEGDFDKNTNPIDIDTKQEYVIKYNTAKLHFRIVAGRNLLYLVDGVPQPSISAYCEAVFPKDKTKETKYITDTKDPNWSYSYVGTFDLPEDLKKVPEVAIKIKQKTGMLSKDVVLSSLSVNLQKCFEKKGVWAINELIPIPGEEKLLRPLNAKNMGEVYIQSKIVEGGRIDDEVEPELKIVLPKANEGEIRGTLLINVIHCRDLPIMDSGMEGSLCDALVHFNTPGGSEVETPVISNNLNPIFNRKLIMFYKVAKAEDVKPLKVSVFDSDRLSGRDLVGVVNVDIMQCISSPNKWTVNKIFDIQEVPADKKIKGETPQVYFQLKFLSEGEIDDGSDAGLLEDLSKIVSNRTRDGTLIFRVIHAKGLIRGDSGMTGSASDPYVMLELPPADTKYKTKVIANTLVPFWNETIKHPLQISDTRYVKKAKITVWDSDSVMAGGDDLIGNAELDLAPLFQARNEWAINKLIELDGPESLKKSLKIKKFWVSVPPVSLSRQGS